MSAAQAMHPGPSEKASEQAQRLEAEGQHGPAQAAYARLGQFEDAARVALRQGKHAEAAGFYAAAGQDLHAARCYLEAGDSARYLDHLIRTPASDPHYGQVVLAAIHAALQLSTVPFRLMSFLEHFIDGGPRDERGQDALYRLADLCETQGLEEEAERLLHSIDAQEPGFRDVPERLAGLEMSGAQSLPSLPSLPDLPALGEVRAPTPNAGRARTVTPSPLADDSRSETVTPLPSQSPEPLRAVSGGGYEPGRTIGERYVLQEEIGRGGMAVVYQAFDLELGEAVALKVFTAADTEDMVSRFREELRLSRRVRHENVIQLYDIGVHAGRRYISMELLLGSPLTALMGSPVPLEDGVGWLVQACAGLQALHDGGAIHRDVKPDNLFVSDRGVVKVMDLGIAKVAAVARQTQAGTILGTPHYMAPEQFRAESQVTPAVDLYALGVVAYELFTGRLPFEQVELLPLLLAHTSQPPVPPRKLNPDLPEALEQIILRLLAKTPEERFGSCSELAERLKELRGA